MKPDLAVEDEVFLLARNLGPASVAEVHARLAEAVGRHDKAPVQIVLDGEGDVSVLSLQLLVSARKSAAPGAIAFCDASRACLSDVEHTQET